MSLSDRKVSIISLIVAIVAVVISTIIGLAALSQSNSIAIESGALKKPELHAFIGHVDLLSGKNHRIIFGASNEQMEQGLVISPFAIAIENSGDSILENVYLTYRYHKMLKRSALEHLSFTGSGSFVDGDIVKKFSSSGTTDYVTYHIPKLNPSVALGIDEPFVLHETKVSDTVPYEGYELPYTIYYSIKFQMSISASTQEHQDYDFEVSVIDSDSLDNLQKKFTEQVIAEEMDKLRLDSTLIQYLGVLLFNNKQRDAVLVFSENEKVVNGEAVIYFPNEGNVNYRTVWYQPAAWGRLL